MKTTFWGKSLEITPLGNQNVRLKSTQEHFIIERPSSSANNLIFGEMYIDTHGTMVVKNLKTGDTCRVDFKRRGWTGKGAYEVEGLAFLNGKDKKARIFGKWNSNLSIEILSTNEQKEIWVANPRPAQSESMYNFTSFTL